MSWTQEPLDQKLTRHLRRDIRAHRREKGRGGHRYVFKDLKEMHALRTAVGAVTHVVLTHHEDPAWLVFAWHVSDGWLLIDWCEHLNQAQAAAESHTWETESPPEADPAEPGIFVLASRPVEGQSDAKVIRIPCHSKNTAIAIADIFRHLGYATEHEVVAG